MAEQRAIRSAMANHLRRLPFVGMAARRILRVGSCEFKFHHVLPQGEKCCQPEMVTPEAVFSSFGDSLSVEDRFVPLDLSVTRTGELADRRQTACALTFDGRVDATNRDKAHVSFAGRVAGSRPTTSERKNVESERVRIRIAFIIDLIEGWTAGTESHLHRLIRILDKDRFDPELICILPCHDVAPDSFPCRVHFLCAHEEHPGVLTRLLRLVRLLRRRRPHIVQTYFPEGNTLGICAAWLARTPMIIGTTRNTSRIEKLRMRLMRRVAGMLADYWQCNSRAVLDLEHKKFGTAHSKLLILPNAVDLTRFSPPDPDQRQKMRACLGLNMRSPIIVSVANLRPVKDLRTLVRAARLVCDHLPNTHFLLVGKGPLYDELQRQVRESGLTDVVELAGEQSDVTPYLASADIGVLTSLSEGSSHSVLEYMAMGLPSVVSDIPPNRELINGLFFAPGDATDLARKILLLCEDETLRTRLRGEYLSTAQQHSSESFELRVQDYYSELAADINLQ